MAYGTSSEVRVKGLRELQRALNRVNKAAAKTVRDELKQVAEPVKQSAERLAGERITNIGPVWGRMRIGARSSSVYIAPRQRNRGGSPRPNLGVLLLERSMFPALDENEHEIVRGVERALDHLLDAERL